jgi:4-hydroxybenzoate polyprenyltransferase/geranylgeranylglycerol-phosphate geranylgeranyltransferase
MQVRLRLRDHLVAHVEAWRPDLSTYAGLVSLSGAVLSMEGAPTWRLIGAWLSPTLGWVAAMYGGDYFDRHLDTVAKPHRPIPSGRMRAGEALAGMIICIGLGMIVAVVLNPLNLLVVAATTVLGVTYSKWLKARGIWGNLIRGGVTAMAFILGTLAVRPTPPLVLIPIALVFWLHDSGSNVVGAICDQDGDRKGGYRTFPVVHGDTAALWLLVAFDVGWLALAAGYPFALRQPFDELAYLPYLAIAAALGLTTVVMLFRAPRPIPRLDALRAHEYLVLGRLALAAAFIASATSAWLASALLVPSAAATLLASLKMMRRRYEPSRVRTAEAAR